LQRNRPPRAAEQDIGAGADADAEIAGGPTYSPASAPAGMPVVGAKTPQANTLPALTPTSMPTVLMAPS
jgi:hypothetical protein